MMRLYILRHGQAEPYRSDDESRALVPRGVTQVKHTAKWLHSQFLCPTKIFASPYLRAQQTAETVVAQAAWPLAVTTESLLQPDSDPQLTAMWLQTLPDGDYLLAAHMPLVSRLTEWLTTQHLDFATASLAVVVQKNGIWQLQHFFTPPQ